MKGWQTDKNNIIGDKGIFFALCWGTLKPFYKARYDDMCKHIIKAQNVVLIWTKSFIIHTHDKNPNRKFTIISYDQCLCKYIITYIWQCLKSIIRVKLFKSNIYMIIYKMQIQFITTIIITVYIYTYNGHYLPSSLGIMPVLYYGCLAFIMCTHHIFNNANSLHPLPNVKYISLWKWGKYFQWWIAAKKSVDIGSLICMLL